MSLAFDLSGRTALITGGAAGIGRAICDTLANSGASIVVLDYNDAAVDKTESELGQRGHHSIAAHVEPKILLIDEILSVGDQDFQRKSSEKIEEFRREGRTIVVVSHSLGLVQQLCKEVIWLEKGQIKQIGNATDVISAYTGGSYAQHIEKDDESRERWGTGDARINSLELLTSDGSPTQRIESDSEVKIRCEMTAHARLESPILRVSITKLNGDVIWATSTQRGTNTVRVLDGCINKSR